MNRESELFKGCDLIAGRSNLAAILSKSKQLLKEARRDSTIEKSVEIANREGQISQYFKEKTGIDYDSL